MHSADGRMQLAERKDVLTPVRMGGAMVQGAAGKAQPVCPTQADGCLTQQNVVHSIRMGFMDSVKLDAPTAALPNKLHVT